MSIHRFTPSQYDNAFYSQAFGDLVRYQFDRQYVENQTPEQRFNSFLIAVQEHLGQRHGHPTSDWTVVNGQRWPMWSNYVQHVLGIIGNNEQLTDLRQFSVGGLGSREIPLPIITEMGMFARRQEVRKELYAKAMQERSARLKALADQGQLVDPGKVVSAQEQQRIADQAKFMQERSERLKAEAYAKTMQERSARLKALADQGQLVDPGKVVSAQESARVAFEKANKQAILDSIQQEIQIPGYSVTPTTIPHPGSQTTLLDTPAISSGSFPGASSAGSFPGTVGVESVVTPDLEQSSTESKGLGVAPFLVGAFALYSLFS